MDYELKTTAELEALRKSIMDDIRAHQNAAYELDAEYTAIRDIIIQRRLDEARSEKEGQR